MNDNTMFYFIFYVNSVVFMLITTVYIHPCICEYTAEVECSFELPNEGEVKIGQTMELSCMKFKFGTNILMDLNGTSLVWYRMVPGQKKEEVVGDTWLLTGEDNGVIFLCVEEDVEGYEELCFITPLEIKPSVTISRHSMFETKDSAMFVCQGDSVPDIDTYTFYVNNDIVKLPITGLETEEYRERDNDSETKVMKIKLLFNNVLEISQLSEKNKGMLITCEVNTSTGVAANVSIVYQAHPNASSSPSDKIMLLGFMAAGGIPIVFVVFAAACWVVRMNTNEKQNGKRTRSLTVEEEDLSPSRPGLPNELSDIGGVTTDMPANSKLQRTYSQRSVKDKVGPMSQLVLPPIGPDANRIGQHIYDETPNSCATSELALSSGERGNSNTASLPSKTYTSRSSLYRMSGDYSEIPVNKAHRPYENVSLPAMRNGLKKNGRHKNSTLPPQRY